MKTKKQPTPATLADQRPTCPNCGGRNVEDTAWIRYRPDGTAEIVDGEGPCGDEYGTWCHDCQEHAGLVFPETTPADNASRRAADAAREAGPELLKALRWAVGEIADHLDRDHYAQFAAACQLLDRLAARS
jgi:hypothetical protein